MNRTTFNPQLCSFQRLARLWAMYARLDFLAISRSPKMFAGYFLSDAVVCAASVAGTLLLAERFDGIGPWTKPQVLFMLGYAMLINGLISTLFNYNVGHISRRLGRGQFDHTLLQPQPVWMALLTEGFGPFMGSAMLVPAVGLMLWAGRGLTVSWSAGWAALLVLNVLGSLAAALAFSYGFGSLAFWAPRGAEEISSSVFRMVTQLKGFPLDGTTPAITGALLTVLPVGLVAWYPCRALLGLDPAPGSVWVTPAAGLLLGLLAAWVFKRGMVWYGRTGSIRYSTFGHRR